MRSSILRGVGAAALAGTLVFTAACERHDHGGHAVVSEITILDRSTTPHSPIATWTPDGGWNQTNLVTMSHSADAGRTRVSLGAQVLDGGGHEIPLTRDGEYGIRYGVASDPNGVIDLDTTDPDFYFHGDHVHIYSDNDARLTGSAQIVFALWHDDHSDAETDPITVTVTD